MLPVRTWVTPRFLWTLGAIAFLLACSPGAAFLVPLCIALALALTLCTLADALLGPAPGDLSVERRPPAHFALGVPAEIAYAIENRSRRWVALGILETPVRTLRFAADDPVAAVPARSRASVSRSVVPVARGADDLASIYLWYENRFGLLRRRLRLDAAEAIRVYPDLSAVERYGKLHSRNRTIETGLRRMQLRGAGTEFESLRDWTEGDGFRAIDWKATARRGKIMAAQHEIERSQNLMLLLDCGRLMTARLDGRRKLDYAVTAALSLATVAGLASDRVGLVAFAGELLAARAPRSTRSSIAGLSDALYALEPRFEEANYSRAFAYLRHHLHKRSMVVFLTDVIDPLAQSAVLADIASLARRHLLVCVFMNDAAVEAALETQPATVRQAYRANVALGLAGERRVAKAVLERKGAIVIDVPAKKLSTTLIDEYLRAKRRGLL